MVKAAKNYQMKKCNKCEGKGTGVGWICTNCGGDGKVSIYPPVPNSFYNYSTFYECQSVD